jgi:hypothetical protein
MNKLLILAFLFLSMQMEAQLLTPKWTQFKHKDYMLRDFIKDEYLGFFLKNDIIYFTPIGDNKSTLIEYDLNTNNAKTKSLEYKLNNNSITARSVLNTKHGDYFIFADEINNNATIAYSDIVNSPDKLVSMYESPTPYKNPFGFPGGTSLVMYTQEDLERDYNRIIESLDKSKFVYVYGQGHLDKKEEKNVTNLVYFDEHLKFQKTIKYESDVDDNIFELGKSLVLNNGDVYLFYKILCNDKIDKKEGLYLKYFKSDEEVKFNDFRQIVCIKADGTIKKIDFAKNRFLFDIEVIPFDDGIGLFTIYANTLNNRVHLPPEYKNGYIYLKDGNVEIDIDANLPKLTWATAMKFQSVFVNVEEDYALCFDELNGCSSSSLGSPTGSSTVTCKSYEVTMYKIYKDGNVAAKTILDKRFEEVKVGKHLGSSYFVYNDFIYIIYNDDENNSKVAGAKGKVKTFVTKLDMSGKIVKTYFVENLKEGMPISPSDCLYLENGKILLIGRDFNDYMIGTLELP